MRVGGRRAGGPLYLLSAVLPPTAEGDPEREQDETHVEPETLAPGVNAVVAKLVATRQIARCVDLRDAGQAGSNTTAIGVPGDVFECDECIACRLDFSWAKRAILALS